MATLYYHAVLEEYSSSISRVQILNINCIEVFIHKVVLKAKQRDYLCTVSYVRFLRLCNYAIED
jgi:hypothetical protein